MNCPIPFLALLLAAPLAAGAVTPAPSPLTVSAGTLETFTLPSPGMARDVTVDVLLPEGYDPASGRRHPVVYMHDGQNLFDAASTWNGQAWEMDEAVARYAAGGSGEAPIIVGVYCVPETRVGDMMPTGVVRKLPRPLFEAMAGPIVPAGLDGVKGDAYVDFIALDLKPAVDSLYATLPDRAHTSVMGSSMGGLISFYALCRHPEVFGSAACLSTHLTGSAEPNELFPTACEAYLMENLPQDGAHRIYFDTGDTGLDALYVPYFRRVADMVGQLGWGDDRLMTRLYEGQTHTEDCWKSRVDIPLRFILGD